MKEFSLEEYLKNPDREVVTRDGRKVRIICTDRKGDTPIIALVYNANEGQEYGYAFYSDGKYYRDAGDELDLFFAPEKHEGWVNIYKAGVQKETLGCLVTRYVGSSIWPTEEAAKTAADPDPIATIKIEWEE